MMCCLGFCAIATGYKEHEITGKGSPADLTEDCLTDDSVVPIPNNNIKKLTRDYRNTQRCIDAMHINDNPAISDDLRERLLAKILAPYFTLTFED